MPTRLQAALWHLLISCCIALLSAALVFMIWYPGLIAQVSGVRDIYLLVLMVDVILGPAITLLVFNPNTKKKPELTRDVAIVAAIQVLALLYGVHTVFIARPAFIVYNAGRFDVAYANDFDEKGLAQGSAKEYQSLPVLGPKLIASVAPTDVKARNKLLFDSVAGGADLPMLPQYFAPYGSQKTQLISKLQPLTVLVETNPTNRPAVDTLIQRYAASNTPVGFLPLKGKSDDLSVIIHRESGDILEYVALAPWK